MLAPVRLVLALFVAAFLCGPAAAYSLLTHEQLIDLTWQSSVVPLLLSRYPGLSPAQLEHERAYAYGGCVIQDIGYYPLGDEFFSDLTHYVRSGDFVVNLVRDAHNPDELAFAVGALSHYIGDTIGHAEATNLAVPVEFPKLRKRFGNSVNYAQGEHQHVQTEFAFDINEITHHRLAPVRYMRHVGLEVPTQQLALAFYQTYGLNEDFSAGRGRRFNVGAYRFAVHRFIPRIAYATTLLHRRHELADVDNAELQALEAQIAKVEQENNWAQYRRNPGLGTYALAALLFVLPKIGPIKLVDVKGPTTQTEQEYIHTVVQSASELDHALRRFTPPAARPPAAAAVSRTPSTPVHPLPNRDLDTGNPVRPSGYPLTDDTYALLAHRLAAHPQQPISPGIKEDILAYYTNLDLPFATKRHPQAWSTLQADLGVLRSMPTSAEPPPMTTFEENSTAASHP